MSLSTFTWALIYGSVTCVKTSQGGPGEEREAGAAWPPKSGHQAGGGLDLTAEARKRLGVGLRMSPTRLPNVVRILLAHVPPTFNDARVCRVACGGQTALASCTSASERRTHCQPPCSSPGRLDPGECEGSQQFPDLGLSRIFLDRVLAHFLDNLDFVP